ncbi:MAG: AAA domain-containing protein, partial [Gemmatimonadota bacterium]
MRLSNDILRFSASKGPCLVASFPGGLDTERPLTPEDLLVVAPYNAQVRRIQAALTEAGFPTDRVGTVDTFQGQEAPVAI